MNIKRMITNSLVAGLVAATALPALAAVPASAKGREVVRAGNCSGAATSKIKVKLDDGRIDTEFEVDQNRNGQRWRVTLRDNGTRFFRGVRTTHAPSGSFTVERLTRNRAGKDNITARAVNLASGQVCRASATF